MKKLILLTLLVAAHLSAQAGGYGHSHYGHGHGYHSSPSVSFHFGVSPYYYGAPRYYAPFYSSYPYAPSYSYPVYSDYTYSRPNYAVGGTLLGALAGGLIGNSVHHQGWEGAGIGAAAGLLLGSLAEHNVRARESADYSTAVVSYPSSRIPDAPAVNAAPVAPAAPQVQSAPVYQPASSMSGANGLFGR